MQPSPVPAGNMFRGFLPACPDHDDADAIL